MKKLSISLVLVLFCCTAIAQDKNAAAGSGSGYKTGVGLRFGFEGGLTVKHFIQSDRAIEGILSTGWGYGGFRLTGLYEVQKPLKGVDNLDWYFGGGLHIGSYSGRYYGYYGVYGNGYYDKHGVWHPNGARSRYLTLGIDGIIGMEYKFEDVPISLSLDFKPFFDIIGSSSRYGEIALSARFLLR